MLVPPCSTMFYCVLLVPCCAVLCVPCAVCCTVLFLCVRPEVVVGKGGLWPGASQDGGPLPIPTNAPDQTKNQVVLHVEHPTKPYRITRSLSEIHWCIWFGLPTLTSLRIWLAHRYRIVLPCLTSRGVKYTHNDHKHSIPRSDSGPTRIRPIPQEHIQKEIVHTPNARHNVADRHAVATL